MLKSQLIAAIASNAGISKAQAEKALATVGDCAKETLVNVGAPFTVPGIGTLRPVQRAARKGRAPSTGAVIDIPAKTVLKLTVEKGLREMVASS